MIKEMSGEPGVSFVCGGEIPAYAGMTWWEEWRDGCGSDVIRRLGVRTGAQGG